RVVDRQRPAGLRIDELPVDEHLLADRREFGQLALDGLAHCSPPWWTGAAPRPPGLISAATLRSPSGSSAADCRRLRAARCTRAGPAGPRPGSCGRDRR